MLEYCKLIKGSGKFVFFHSGGNISSIFSEFIDIGCDAINTQLSCMGIEEAAKYKGKVTFWGDIDVQRIVETGSPKEVKEYIRRLRRVLDDGTGGVIAQYEWNPNPNSLKENIMAYFEAWNELINYKESKNV